MLHENMASVKATEILEERRSELGERQVYYLTLVSTGSKEAAEDAYTEAVERTLREGRTPEAL